MPLILTNNKIVVEFPKGEDLTFAQILDQAMRIFDKENADEFMPQYIDFILKKRHSRGVWITRTQATEIAKQSIAYYAGLHSILTQLRVQELFGAHSPYSAM